MKALATYYATLNDLPDTEFKVEILEDGPVKKISVNGNIYEVDYNVGGDTIHSIIMNNKSHGVQITSLGNSDYEVRNKGDYFLVNVVDELKNAYGTLQIGNYRSSGDNSTNAGRYTESICQAGRRSESRRPALCFGSDENGERNP